MGQRGKGDADQGANLLGLSSPDIVALAFRLKRPPVGSPRSTFTALSAQQEGILSELFARGDAASAASCATNWLNRGLLFEHPSKEALRGEKLEESEAWLFDGITYVRGALFLSQSTPNLYMDVLESSPLLLARCVRDEKVVSRLTNHAAVLAVVKRFLEEVTFCPAETPNRKGEKTSDIEVYWRAVSPLLRLIRTHLQSEKVQSRQRLLDLFMTALEHSTQSQQQTDKMKAALRNSTESICSSLLHNEATVRHIGLSVFAKLACCLRRASIHLPNALVACLFLCMGQSSTAPVEGNDDTLLGFVNSRPTDRWKAALVLIHEAEASKAVRVTPLHFRCLLSGMQSIPAVETWEVALRCLSVFKKVYRVDPDENSVGRLLQYHRRIGWEKSLQLAMPKLGRTSKVNKIVQAIATSTAGVEVKRKVLDTLLQSKNFPEMDPLTFLYAIYMCTSSNDYSLLRTFWGGFLHCHQGTSFALAVAVTVVGYLDVHNYSELDQFLKDAQNSKRRSADSINLLVSASVLSKLLQEDNEGALAALHAHVSTSEPSAEVKRSLTGVFDTALVLLSLTGMEHLHEPILLVYDVLEFSCLDQVVSGLKKGTRKRLYIPASHVKEKEVVAAKLFGRLTSTSLTGGTALEEGIAMAMGESCTRAGVGPEYFSAAFI
ncbi:hypothetical protein ADEAN_000008000 [Angomonas deanei]|uniref:Uncharacterized protein n=1 Tax=Angomonas deanei TaxID=59799 RepID=A0A7G2BYS7_9TRYP|nr:hypothetical protein ADEAN_000008000 [Angomonas deanei]